MENQPIDFSKLFNFSDTSSIQEAINLIVKLESVYSKMIETTHSQVNKYSGDINALKEEAANLLKVIESLNGVATKNAEAYNNVAKSVDNLSKENDELKKKEAEAKKAYEEMEAQLKKLKDAKDKLTNENKKEAGSIDDLKKKLDDATKAYKAMGNATDKAIKEDQLKRIAELDKSYKEAAKAINDAKKATEFAAGSYNELSKRVADGKKQLREMAGGIQGNTAEFKKLRAEVKANDQVLKDWDERIGDNKRNVGDYKNQIGAIVPGFSQFAGGVETITEAGKKFTSSGFGLILLLVAGAIASITAYFQGSIEGQDKWNKVVAYGTTLFEIFKDGLEFVGKLLVSIWENPRKAISDFWDFLKQNLVNRFLGLGKIFQAVGKIISSGFTDGFKDFANATLQVTTGVENLLDKTLAASKALAEDAAKRLAIAEKLANKENLIRKEKIKDVVDDAMTELKVNKLLEDSKDKLKFADEDRLKKVREARRLVNEQLEGDLMLAQLEIDAQKLRIEQAGGLLLANKKLSQYTNEEIVAIGVKYELVEKLAQLEAAQINTEAAASTKRKALQKQEIALIQEISAAYFDRIKREKQAQVEIDTYIQKSIIEKNKMVLANEDATLQERLTAIKENSQAELALLDITRAKEIDGYKEASLAKVELDSETSAKIFNDKTKTLQQQLQLEKDYKELALMNDGRYAQEKAIYLKQEEKVNKEYFDKLEELNNKSKEQAEENIFKVLSRDFAILNNELDAESNKALDKLNQSYLEGNLNYHAFERNKIETQAESIRLRLRAELDYLDTLIKQSGLTQQQISEIEAKQSAIRLQLSEQTAQQVLENEKKLRAAIDQIAVESVNFTQALFDADIQRNIDGLNAKLASEEAAKNASLAIAGNDAQAKALIEQNFANKKKDIERQIAAEKRKSAIFDKARAAGSIIVDTARGIMAALGSANIPLSIAIGAIGALQLATVVAAPIPSYWTGTENSKEGYANVAERGKELAISPDGDVTLYKKKQIAYLKKGTKVFNASKTQALVDQATKYGDGYMGLQSGAAYSQSSDRIASTQQASITFETVVHALKEHGEEIIQAIKSQPSDVWDDNGYRRFLRYQNTRVQRLDSKYKL